MASAFKILFFVSLFISFSARAQEQIGPPKGPANAEPDIFAPSDLTPNLSPRSNLWAETSPELQIGLGIGDVLFLGYSRQLYIPEFLQATQRFKAQQKKEGRAKSLHDKAYQKMVNEQKSLQELQASSQVLEKNIDTAGEQIKRRTTELEKARRIITAGEKEVAITRVKEKMVKLYSHAIQEHQGKINTHEDMYRALTSKEHEEILALKEEYNSLREMPDVNLEQKAVIIKDAELALQTVQDERDSYIAKIRQLKDEIGAQSHDIEHLQGELNDLDGKLKIEQQSSELLKRDMEQVGRRFGLRPVGYKILRVGGRIVFGVDIGGRLLYYFVAQQDPGWFPFAKILQRIL